jgi:hypothetical protein
MVDCLDTTPILRYIKSSELMILKCGLEGWAAGFYDIKMTSQKQRREFSAS